MQERSMYFNDLHAKGLALLTTDWKELGELKPHMPASHRLGCVVFDDLVAWKLAETKREPINGGVNGERIYFRAATA